MARKKGIKGWENALWMILGVIALVGVGGLFVKGTFTSVVLLSYLPQIVHTIVGWLIIILTLIGAGANLYRKIA